MSTLAPKLSYAAHRPRVRCLRRVPGPESAVLCPEPISVPRSMAFDKTE